LVEKLAGNPGDFEKPFFITIPAISSLLFRAHRRFKELGPIFALYANDEIGYR
jgi:hypothetical protein